MDSQGIGIQDPTTHTKSSDVFLWWDGKHVYINGCTIMLQSGSVSVSTRDDADVFRVILIAVDTGPFKSRC